jgi:hypothetical protein
MNTATVTITLEYDLDNMFDTLLLEGEQPSDEEVYEVVEDYTYEDLTELMRGDRLKYWSEVKIERTK